ncbi:hypothetical protein PsorP6_005684 [Peronosclerospora sorghi]|uniref:Uncharacterized protein n=1 Tax=Peronosclerospora sorghi TaxID=230839 RepID=A0ACC0W2Z6_9STRA|nr:hypothetical protein PsorP6_005684 [Peronosclerospora sorghi]
MALTMNLDSLCEWCIFVNQIGGDYIYIRLYVYDLLIAAKYEKRITTVNNQLKLHFNMKDFYRAKFVIGIEIEHNV